jgi:r1t holin
MWTRTFWKATLDRAVRTFAQAMIGTGVAAAASLPFDWRQALTLSMVAALVSVLTSLAGMAITKDGPGLVEELKPAGSLKPPAQ